MELKDKWENLIDKNQTIYIYGAGKIGKKVLRLIRNTEYAINKVKGFLVSDLAGNPKELEGFPVMMPENISDRRSLILVSVTDIYQETIVEDLRKLGFMNIIDAYQYSFMEADIPSAFPKTIDINTDELLLCQYEENLFNRYDIVISLLAIEEYYGKNNCGFSLYEKLQNCRFPNASNGRNARQGFIKLIEDYEGNVYRGDAELIVDEALHLVDGVHRLALAIYFGVDGLAARIEKKEIAASYGKAWISELFSREESQTIEKKLSEIEAGWEGAIKGILWPSVAEYFDEIVSVIKEQYPVEHIDDITFEADAFERKVKEIYRMDSIAEWKINTKLKYLKPFSPYHVRIFDIYLGNPDFRMSKAAKGILSDKGVKLKEKIRDMYKKKITGYFSDIIFHTADNYHQSKCIEKLFYEETAPK